MRRALQAILAAGGAAAIGIGVAHVALGPALVIPGAGAVNATLDSEDRFYATLFVAYGAALLACSRDIDSRRDCIRFLALTLFAGGVARVVSLLAVGWPHPFFVAMTLLELVLPPVIVAMLARVAVSSSSGSTLTDSEP